MTHLAGKKVAVLATDYFEEKELTEPVRVLRHAGVDVDIIAPHAGEIVGLNHITPGQSVPVDKTLDTAIPDAYDALVVPGGAINVGQLRMEQKARDFIIRIMGELERPTAVICHGPWLLISSRLIRGRRLSGHYTIQDDIVNGGGEWVDEAVVTDGCLITSRSVHDLPMFNQTLLKALSDGHTSPMLAAM